MSSVAQHPYIQFTAPYPDAKCGSSPVPLKRSSSSLAIRRPRRLSSLRLAPAKSPSGSPRLSSKKKPRLALQTIHVRALEHGLRVPVCNTPLGIVDQAENIIHTPTRLDFPMTALPTTASFPRLDLLGRSDAASPPSPTRRPHRARRNSMS
ncbi:hypothetical protein H4R23_000871 [Coemansia sp. Cherry 401B]|nr:hypothetical protein IWW54_003431 [Coemansia sp. RSA 2705]KAJ2319426.1 hypothetical protein IWW52_001973 [Coemansia sp. RSA 2704]KAJ2364969.1 hypothetical protein H4S01_003497 [Coemansia sp. RSA 2610]KAJ2738831.1 hypothetical protein H4R23_000871 [Coemansia sp. Cherry 401B]